jgi:cation transport protein ChaC
MRIKPPDGRPVTQTARWLTVDSQGERIRAVAFVLNRRGPGYQGVRSHQETAEVLSKSCGFNGSGAEYLYKTVKRLAEHGIYDRNLWELQELVARRIRERHGVTAGRPAQSGRGSVRPAPQPTKKTL